MVIWMLFSTWRDIDLTPHRQGEKINCKCVEYIYCVGSSNNSFLDCSRKGLTFINLGHNSRHGTHVKKVSCFISRYHAHRILLKGTLTTPLLHRNSTGNRYQNLGKTLLRPGCSNQYCYNILKTIWIVQRRILQIKSKKWLIPTAPANKGE